MTKKQLYTIVLEFEGGTYIAQVSAESPVAALPGWLSRLHDEDLAKWGTTRGELTSIIESDHPVPVDGCLGVCCLTGSGKKGLVLINIIATDGSP